MARKNQAAASDETQAALPPPEQPVESSSNGQPEPQPEPPTNGEHRPVSNGYYEEHEGRQRPVFEMRLGVVKTAIWANHTDLGVKYNVTHGRLYRREDTGEWYTAQNYGRDQIPALIEALRICYLRIFEMQQSETTPF